MHIESTMRNHFTPTGITVIKEMETTNVENVEKLEPSFIAGRDVK